MQDSWAFKQHFRIRASTMLLAFSLGLLALAFTDAADTITQTIPGASVIFWRLDASFGRYQMLSALFSLFFMGRSIIKREPQIQFIIELILAGILYRLVSS